MARFLGGRCLELYEGVRIFPHFLKIGGGVQSKMALWGSGNLALKWRTVKLRKRVILFSAEPNSMKFGLSCMFLEFNAP